MKRARISTLLTVITIVIAMLFVSACSKDKDPVVSPVATNATATAAPTAEPAAPTAEPEDMTPVTLKFTNWAGSDTYKKVNDAFTAKYPWITIEWVSSGGPQATVEESIAAGAPIDVFFNPTISDAVAKNLAEDLTPYIEKDAEFNTYPFIPGIMEQFKIAGKQYALPRGTETFLIFYNKDLLEEYGLDVPANDWTWEQLREMAIKATDPSKGRYGFGNSGLVYQFGGPVMPMANGSAPNLFAFDADFTKTTMDQPAVMDDLQWFANLALKDKVFLDAKGSAAANIEGDIWEKGNALFSVHVSALMETWDTSLKFNWDVLPFPKGKVTQPAIMWNQPLMMTKAGKNKDATWKFMKFFTTSKEAQDIFMEKATLLPNNTAASVKDTLTALPFYSKYNVDAIIYAVSKAVVDPQTYIVGGSDIAGVYNNWAMEKMLKEGTSAYDFLPAEVEKVNKTVADLQAKYPVK